MDPELIAAYVRTEYRVEDSGFSFTMHVDEPSAPLRACHAAFAVHCSAFITAWNPRSEAVPRSVNEAAMSRLERELESLHLRWLRGEGVDPVGEWPGEPSVLVLGLDQVAAITLGRTFEQNAVVCAAADGIARLVLCL
jgi:hypothetical protein